MCWAGVRIITCDVLILDTMPALKHAHYLKKSFILGMLCINRLEEHLNMIRLF